MSFTHEPATHPRQRPTAADHTDELPLVAGGQAHAQASYPQAAGQPAPGGSGGKVLTTRNTLIAGGIGVAAAFALIGFGAGYVAGDGGSSDGRPGMSQNGGPGRGMQGGMNGTQNQGGMQGQNGMQGGQNGMQGGQDGMGGGPGGTQGGMNGQNQTGQNQTGQDSAGQTQTGQTQTGQATTGSGA